MNAVLGIRNIPILELKYQAFDGCSTNPLGNFFKNEAPPGFYSASSSIAGLVCCALDGSICTRICIERDLCKGDNALCNKLNWEEADRICKDRSMRLCNSQQEIDKCCGKGCDYDNRLVWSNVIEGSAYKSTILPF